MSWLPKLINFISRPFADIVGGWQGRKTAAAQTVNELALLEGDLKKARIKAEIKRIENQDNKDADYDQKVLDNRKYTIMDDVLIIFWFVVFTLHFVKGYALIMKDGWLAIGNAPWWFQFGMLGILVSTLGLMRLFRMYTENKFSLGNKNGN
jgi:hypothetical protein